jgi:ABC-type uncharacterized transport system permease subunit
MFIGALLFAVVGTLPVWNLWFSIIVAVVFTGGYAIKNKWLPSNSPEGELNGRDIVSGLFLAIVMGLSDLVASSITGEPLTGKMVAITISGIIVQYFTKTISTGTKLE